MTNRYFLNFRFYHGVMNEKSERMIDEVKKYFSQSIVESDEALNGVIEAISGIAATLDELYDRIPPFRISITEHYLTLFQSRSRGSNICFRLEIVPIAKSIDYSFAGGKRQLKVVAQSRRQGCKPMN